MRRREFLASGGRAAVGLWLTPVAARQPSWRADLDELEQQISDLMQRDAVPGAAAVIIKDAAVAWRRSFGVRDAESMARVDSNTVFSVGSMSKPPFAYAVMQLCEKGVMSLDTPLTQYTPERYLAGDPRLDLITARHVLSHTSGFQNWRSEKEPLTIHFTPGQKFLYSGEGYSYLQSVVTRLKGRVNPQVCGRYEAGLEVCATDIERYMKSHLFSPFGMSSAAYVWSPGVGNRLARPHGTKGEPLAKIRPSATDAARYAAAGGLLTTAADYAKFALEVIDPRETGDFRLKKKTVAEMIRPQVETHDEFSSSWALGWQVEKTGVIHHGGYNTGFHSHAVASLDHRSGFVIVTNGEGGGDLILKLLTGEVLRRLL